LYEKLEYDMKTDNKKIKITHLAGIDSTGADQTAEGERRVEGE
jgi:hypothetical protein